MITFKRLVNVFILFLIVPLCVCYSVEDDIYWTPKNPERYFTDAEVNNLEKLFKSGNDNWKAYSLDRDQVLRYAALNGNLDWVKRIVEKGADVNKSERHRMTPLHFAAISGNPALVEYLVEHDANVNAKDIYEKSALLYAAEVGSLELVKYLAEHGADVNEADPYDETALHYAAESGSLELVKWLVDQGLDINAKDSNHSKYSVLLYAVESDSLELVQWLVERGADINVTDDYGKNALWHAKSLELVQWLMEQGVDINAKNNNGETPIFAAALNKTSDRLQWMVEHGADVNVKDSSGHSAFSKVSRNCYLKDNDKHDLFLWLLERDADLNKCGDDVLLSAAEFGDLELVKLLAEKGVNVKNEYPNHTTALHKAAQSDNLELIQWLIDQGVDVNAETEDGKTALMYACLYDSVSSGSDHLKMVQLLVEHGAKTNPNLGKKWIPYWLQLWAEQASSGSGVNYPLIHYLMLHDTGFICAVLIIFLTVILSLLYFVLIRRAKKNEDFVTK